MTVDFLFQPLGYGFPQHHPRSAQVHESTRLRQVVLPGAPERVIGDQDYLDFHRFLVTIRIPRTRHSKPSVYPIT